MIRHLAILAVTLATAEAVAQPAEPFVRTRVANKPEVCLYWQDREYAYHYDAAGSEKTPNSNEFFAMDAAFRTWSAVASACSDFKFTKRTPLTNPTVGFIRTEPCDADGNCKIDHPNTCFQPGTGICDKARNVCNYQVKAGADCANANVITFREVACRNVVPDGDPCYDITTGGDPYMCGSKYRCWDQFDTTIAVTTATHSTRSGIIFDADIEFNAAPAEDGTSFLFTTVNSPPCDAANLATTCVANDIQNTLTHEIGHVIGLDHTTQVGSTMEATAPVGETKKRILDSGTQLGLCHVYPPGQLTPVVCETADTVKIVAISNGSPTLADIFGCDQTQGALALPLFGFTALVAGALRRRRRG